MILYSLFGVHNRTVARFITVFVVGKYFFIVSKGARLRTSVKTVFSIALRPFVTLNGRKAERYCTL